MQKLWKYHKISIFYIVLGVLFYWSFAYQLVRTDFIKMSFLWSGLFIISFQLITSYKNQWKTLACIALLFRIIFLLATPNLSQDFYRFIWDGRILLEGLNPYLSLPKNWIAQGNAPIAQADELYQGMGQLNGSHYTNYPPMSQFCYLIAAVVGTKNIWVATIILRILIILADIGTFFFGKKLLKALKLPETNIFWYILNPFVIIELTGNLHFEAVMIFFIIWSLYLLQKNLWHWAAIVLGLSVSVKLIPLLFLPFFFQKFMFGDSRFSETREKNWTHNLLRLSTFYILVFLCIGLSFAPFISEAFIINFKTTITLWFQNFEFNASIYYIIRWIGYQIKGWNMIHTIGKILPLVTILIILTLTFFRKNRTMQELITAMLLGICCYYFLSTTIHPWYIAVPLSLCIFTKYRFPIVWSIVIILSYTAYINTGFEENLYIVALEYLVVFGIFIYEIYFHKKIAPLKSLH